MFNAGSIVFNLKLAGAQVFQQEMTGAEQSAKKVGSASRDTTVATDGLSKKQETAAQTTKRLASEQANAAARARQLGEETRAAQTRVGTAMVAIGASVLAMTALTVKAAVDWESAWAGVTKTVEGTPAELQGVEDGLRDLTKVLPASHTEIAAVAEAAGQLGVQTKNVVAFTRTMIDLGETTNLSANEAATSLARFMNVMGTAQSKVSNLGSSVVELGNNYATTEAEIVAMATRLSGAAKQVGLTEGETLGLAAALSSVGIEAEAGGSAVSKVMIDIAASVDKGGERLDQFAKIAGVSADEFATKWKKDPGDALALFVTGLANAESQGGTTLGMLEELGITEVRMRDALLRSAAASDQFTEAMNTGNKAFEANNALTTEAAKRYDTVASKLQITKNNVMDAAIGFGQVFLPIIADASEGISKFASFLGDLPEPVQSSIAVLTLFAGAVILAGGVALLAVPKIHEFRVATALLATQMPKTTATLRAGAAFLTGPWGVAIAAAALGTKLLTDYLDSLKASTAEYQNVLKTGTTADELFAVADKGRLISRLDEATKSAGAFQEKLNKISTNDFLTGLDLPAAQLKKSLTDIGAELGTLASSDLPSSQRQFNILAESMELNGEQQIQLLNSMPKYRDALIEQAASLGINISATDEAAANTALLELAQGKSTRSSTEAADAYLAAADEVEGLTGTLDDLIDKMNEANGIGQDAVSTNIDYQDALFAVDEQIRQARAGLEGFSLGMDQATQVGRDNMSMINDLAADYQKAAKAQFDLDGNSENYIANLQAGRDALLERAKDLGATDEQLNFIASTIANMPSEKEIQLLIDTETATAKIQGWISAFNGSTIQMNIRADGTTQYRSGSNGRIFEADGGKVEFFGSGGRSENHVAQFARAGTMRVWAEPETGGEWYIPASPAKRQRSTQVLKEAANEFGYELVPAGARSFADGGRSSDAQIMSGRGHSAPTEIVGTLEIINGRAYISGVIQDELGGRF